MGRHTKPEKTYKITVNSYPGYHLSLNEVQKLEFKKEKLRFK